MNIPLQRVHTEIAEILICGIYFAHFVLFYRNITFPSMPLVFFKCFQGLWFDKDSSLWMLPSMSDDLASLLNKRGISKVQQLLDLPKATLQTTVGNFPASRLYQVQSALLSRMLLKKF